MDGHKANLHTGGPVADYTQTWEKLNPAERLAIALQPLSVPAASDSATKALAEAKRRFPVTLHNGPGDAFRHCYWAALMTRDIGTLNTLALTDAHEEWDGNPSTEKAMDLHNNRQGIVIGVMNRTASDAQLADLCHEALRAGKLRLL
jgi:hypothetical protein